MKYLLIVFIWLFSNSAQSQVADTVYYNSTSTYYITNTAGNTYNWSVASPGVITSGQGTNSITVYWGAGNAGNISNAISVYATNQYGCPSRLIGLDIVLLIPPSKIFYPNAFTPNGDGINDGWSPIPFNIIEIRWMVYNRYGEKVYETNKIGDKWNGIYKRAPQGTFNFVWICWWRGVDGKNGFDKGNLILIR